MKKKSNLNLVLSEKAARQLERASSEKERQEIIRRRNQRSREIQQAREEDRALIREGSQEDKRVERFALDSIRLAAQTSEDTLREALAAHRERVAATSKTARANRAEVVTRADRGMGMAKAALRAAQERLQAAQERVTRARADLASSERLHRDSLASLRKLDQDQDLTGSLEGVHEALRASEESWSAVGKAHRKRNRDRDLRRAARALLR